MNIGMQTLGSTLAPAFVAGLLAAIVGLFWFDGPSPVSAQADTTAPTVSSVAITSDPDENDADLGAYSVGRSGGSIVQSSNWASGVYRIGDDVQVTVTFSEDIIVTGSPQLGLAIGSSNRTAEYESTDGSAAVFSYTVGEGDTDSDGLAMGANKLTLNSGSIKDAADNDANLSHNALADQDGHKVDGIRPRIARFFLASSTGGSDGAYSADEEIIIFAEFTEDHPRGSVTGPPQVKLDFDGEEKMAQWDISLLFNSPQDYGIFGYVVQEGDLDSDGVAISANSIDLNGGFIRDPAGNDAVLTHSAVAASSSFKVDAVAPTVSSIAITSDPGDDDTYGTGDRVEVTVTFSENMSLPISISCSADVVHCEAELELDIGGTARTADYQSHAGADVVFAYTVQAGDTDDDGIAIGANKLTGQRIRDAAGRHGEGINDADLSHDAVADDAGHKVSGSSSSLTLSGSTTINYEENGEGSVSTYTLSGSDGDVTWSLSGDDSDDFFLSGDGATTRALSFISSPNYEDPTDSDADNQYDVTIQASDGTNTSRLQVTVFVTNVLHDADELPVITGTARVGETLTVDTSPISDTDQNTPFGYQWIRTDEDTDTDTNIDGATNSSYALTDDDEGKTIKVLVGFRTTGGRYRLISAPTEVVVSNSDQQAINTPATGIPTISGTVQVSETLTVGTSGISDTDGLDNAAYRYQWIANDGTTDTVITGATNATYTLVSADEGKTVKVRVSFTDDAGNSESLTSAATAAIAAAVVPLTAEFQAAPESHNGSGSFTLRILFSEPIGTSYRTIRDHSLEVSGGSVTGARRVDLRSDLWEVTVVPDSNTDVTIALPAGRACGAEGAVCTGGGKILSNRPEITVPGPAPVNAPATGAPTISGTAQVGETLTADTSGISDAEGLAGATFVYQWIANDGTTDTEITGATTSTYTLVSANRGKTIKVQVTFTDDAGNDETLTSAASATVAAYGQFDSTDNTGARSYITIVVSEDDSDPDNVVTGFAITWNDAEDCIADYTAYLDGVLLGSANSESEQIAKSLTNVQAESLGFSAKMYCGADDSGRLLSGVWIPEYSRSFNTAPPSHAYMPVPGTYSTEPSLTVLTVSSGTLTPTFERHTLKYSVPDVTNTVSRITFTTTPKDGYSVVFIEEHVTAMLSLCSGSGFCNTSYGDGSGNSLYPLTDADADTPGFQADLDEGENLFTVHVHPRSNIGTAYKLTVTRAAVVPLTAEFQAAPESHNGSGSFTRSAFCSASLSEPATGQSGTIHWR